MSRTWKIVSIVGLCGLLLIMTLALAVFKYVSSHKDDWLAQGRDVYQEGIAAGKTLRDSECLDEAIARHRDGRDGFVGLSVRLWLKGCLQSATPTPAFCRDVPRPTDITGTIGWQMPTCAKRGLPNDASCGRTLSEVQTECATRNAAQ